MFLSVFDIFKIGIGPSSSHTMGPMLRRRPLPRRCSATARPRARAGAPRRLEAALHGCLAFTGKGHATDRAVVLGLLGYRPADLDPDEAERGLAELRRPGRMRARRPAARSPSIRDKDLVFDYGPPLPGHANGLVLARLRRRRQPAPRRDLLFDRRRLRA